MNLVQKFRKFFFALPLNEQKAMWDIMTALRSEDDNPKYALKSYTTCRIRGLLLGRSRQNLFGAIVFATLKKADEYQQRMNNEVSEEKKVELYRESDGHWQSHLESAIRALKKHGFKGKTKDLELFLEIIQEDW